MITALCWAMNPLSPVERLLRPVSEREGGNNGSQDADGGDEYEDGQGSDLLARGDPDLGDLDCRGGRQAARSSG